MPPNSIPNCPHQDGHAWVTGRIERTDQETYEVTSRYCRRCGFQDDPGNSLVIVT